MTKLDKLEGLSLISQFDLRDSLDVVPYHWKLDDYEIEEKIKDLRKQIYELQNSRKKQPKLLTFESHNGEDRCRIFHGWSVRFNDVKDKNPLMVADHWTIATEKDLELIEKHIELNPEALNLIKRQSK